MRDQFDISKLRWVDSDYLCPLCHMLLYYGKADPNRKICVNPKCATSPSPYTLITNVATSSALNQAKQRLDKRIKRFYIFHKSFLYCRLNEIRRGEFHNLFTQNRMDIRRVLGVDSLLTKISHNTIWGTETNGQIFQNTIAEFLKDYKMLSYFEDVESKMVIIGQGDNDYYRVEYERVIEDVRRNLGLVNTDKYAPEDVHAYYSIDSKSDKHKPKHLYDLETMFKTPYTFALNHLFRLSYAVSKIHDYPAEPSHVATLLSLFAKCKPHMANMITRDELREMHDGSVNKNNMNGDFDDFLQTYSSGAKYAPILIFDGQHYHFDYATLTCFFLYLFSLNKHADGTQTVSGYTTFMQQRQERAHSFESTIRGKMRNDGFAVLPQNDSEKFVLHAGGLHYEFDCLAIDCSKRIIVLIEAKYEDTAPSSASGQTMLGQIVLDKKGGLLQYAERQHERRRFLVKNFNQLPIDMTKNSWEYRIHSIIVTKFTPMIKKYLTTVLMSFDEFKRMDFRNFDKD